MSGLGVAALSTAWGGSRSQALLLIPFAERGCVSATLLSNLSLDPYPHLGEGARRTTVAEPGLEE